MSERRVPTAGEIAWVFGSISVLGFGGALPWAHRALVERHRWMSTGEFANTLALCQFLPGPTIVNMAVVVGARYRGPLGSLAGVAALILPPAVTVSLIGTVYMLYAGNPQVRHALAGVAAAAAGLLASTALRLIIVLLKRRAFVPIVFAATAFSALVVLRWPLPLALLVLGPLSIAFAWTKER